MAQSLQLTRRSGRLSGECPDGPDAPLRLAIGPKLTLTCTQCNCEFDVTPPRPPGAVRCFDCVRKRAQTIKDECDGDPQHLQRIRRYPCAGR